MFELIGSLFGSSKAGEKIIDGISNAADKLIYTSEEQADDAAKARSEGFTVYAEWLRSTSGSRLARRLIALMTVGIWVVEHLSSVALGVASVFIVDGTAKQFSEASAMLAANASDNNALVAVVLMFYFGGPVAMDGIKGLVTNWVQKTGKPVGADSISTRDNKTTGNPRD